MPVTALSQAILRQRRYLRYGEFTTPVYGLPRISYGSALKQDIVSLSFVRPDIAVVEVLTSVTGIQKLSPGTSTDDKGRLRTCLLEVMVKDGGEWKIVAYHNTDVKSHVPAPDCRVVHGLCAGRDRGAQAWTERTSTSAQGDGARSWQPSSIAAVIGRLRQLRRHSTPLRNLCYGDLSPAIGSQIRSHCRPALLLRQ